MLYNNIQSLEIIAPLNPKSAIMTKNNIRASEKPKYLEKSKPKTDPKLIVF